MKKMLILLEDNDNMLLFMIKDSKWALIKHEFDSPTPLPNGVYVTEAVAKSTGIQLTDLDTIVNCGRLEIDGVDTDLFFVFLDRRFPNVEVDLTQYDDCIYVDQLTVIADMLSESTVKALEQIGVHVEDLVKSLTEQNSTNA